MTLRRPTFELACSLLRNVIGHVLDVVRHGPWIPVSEKSSGRVHPDVHECLAGEASAQRVESNASQSSSLPSANDDSSNAVQAGICTTVARREQWVFGAQVFQEGRDDLAGICG